LYSTRYADSFAKTSWSQREYWTYSSLHIDWLARTSELWRAKVWNVEVHPRFSQENFHENLLHTRAACTSMTKRPWNKRSV
jgi:hypothetical protein